LDTPTAWKSGIHYHRIEVPCRGLQARGHSTRQVIMGQTIPDELMEYPDVVVMGRVYPEYLDPVKIMKEYQKQGKRVIYDIDDDYWAVNPSNPSRFVSNVFKDQYENLIRNADAITTPSNILAKKIQKLAKKKVFICFNAIDYEDYKERPNFRKVFETKRQEILERLKKLNPTKEDIDIIVPSSDRLVIGYMGAASHWKDLQIILPALEKLNEKYDFVFAIHGIVGGDFDSEIQTYRRIVAQNLQPEQNEYHKDAIDFYERLSKLKISHRPFALPELNPLKLGESDFDIGLAPLEDNEFSKGKSCIKYYEYAAVGTVTLASDVEPYKSECNYLAKNTTDDWYNKLEKLIVDEKFRNDLLKSQQDWVRENRALDKVAIDWELALQNPIKQGAPKVLNQDKSWLKLWRK